MAGSPLLSLAFCALDKSCTAGEKTRRGWSLDLRYSALKVGRGGRGDEEAGVKEFCMLEEHCRNLKI